MAGMVNGTAGPILMMARRWVRPIMTNAALIPLPRAGRYFQVRANRHVLNRRWRALNRYLVRPADKLIALLDPPFNSSDAQSGLYQGLCSWYS